MGKRESIYGAGVNDILAGDHGKLYSAATSVFVPTAPNSFIVDCAGRRGECPVGVSLETHIPHPKIAVTRTPRKFDYKPLP